MDQLVKSFQDRVKSDVHQFIDSDIITIHQDLANMASLIAQTLSDLDARIQTLEKTPTPPPPGKSSASTKK